MTDLILHTWVLLSFNSYCYFPEVQFQPSFIRNGFIKFNIIGDYRFFEIAADAADELNWHARKIGIPKGVVGIRHKPLYTGDPRPEHPDFSHDMEDGYDISFDWWNSGIMDPAKHNASARQFYGLQLKAYILINKAFRAPDGIEYDTMMTNEGYRLDYFLRSLLIHEILHVIGFFNHQEDDPRNVMYPTQTPEKISELYLSPRQEQALICLYGG